jgi:hypothetical protein
LPVAIQIRAAAQLGKEKGAHPKMHPFSFSSEIARLADNFFRLEEIGDFDRCILI